MLELGFELGLWESNVLPLAKLGTVNTTLPGFPGVQGLRIHPAMQGTGVQSLVQADPTHFGATKPVGHNY